AVGRLTWAHLYLVAFLLGSASVFFQVAYSGFFQALVPREQYVQANALLNVSRGFSFFAGTSVGGVLVQLLRGPYALVVDAVSYVWSALFLVRIDAADRRARRCLLAAAVTDSHHARRPGRGGSVRCLGLP